MSRLPRVSSAITSASGQSGRLSRGPDLLVRLALALVLAIIAPGRLAGQEPGAIRGHVRDAETGVPLGLVTVTLQGSETTVLSREDGTFVVPDIPPGRYILAFQLLGYAPFIRSDVIVNPGRVTQADAELQVSAIQLAGIVVTPGWFPKREVQPASLFSFNSEEVRRAPGSAGDVSRALFPLPSTAQVADNANDLFVRGGAPFENGFFIDHIQVPNINHFPTVGSTGGPIGLVNVDFIQDVSFSAGAFPVSYGDRLSSIVEIDFRDGSREGLETRVEATMAGFGGTIEGPLGSRSSWFVSARRSFLDLIVDAIGTGVAPRYGDVHAKLTFERDPRNTVSVLGLFGSNSISFSRQDSEDDGSPAFGDNRNLQGTVGLTWRHLWRGSGYSVTSLSASATNGDDLFFRTASQDTIADAQHVEGAIRLRNVNRVRLSESSRAEFGADLELSRAQFDYVFGAYTDRLGNPFSRTDVDDTFDDLRAGVFASHTWSLTPSLDLTTGLRADYYSGLGETLVSPRASASYRLSERLTLNAAGGLYRQRLPAFLLSQDPSFEKLPAPRAVHAVLGADYLLTESTQLTLEAFRKWYDDLPLEVEDPELSVVDLGTSINGPQTFRTLVPDGKARSYGVEVLVQKKLAQDVYGLVSGAWSRSRYRDLNGAWRDRVSDNRYQFNVVGGYRPSHLWEMSARWTWAGGAPYTPWDMTASTAEDRGIIDATRMLGERYPDYHTLNLRFDRRFVFQGSALTVSASLWNLYNRQNIAFYYWNEVENRPDELLQWSFFPVIGLEWAF